MKSEKILKKVVKETKPKLNIINITIIKNLISLWYQYMKHNNINIK